MSRWGNDQIWSLPHRLIFLFGSRLEMSFKTGMGQFFSQKTAPFMPLTRGNARLLKYIKEYLERIPTVYFGVYREVISISRSI